MTPTALAGGRYRVERRLGVGGMASVFLGHDAELDRPVAIKMLNEAASEDEDFRQRFVREARLAARLAHPNIVAIFDTGQDDGRPFIVMEYVDGETLADVLAREGRLSPERVVDLALQACGGLDHAHTAGLVHRDVKPGNLLVRADGGLKIVDFGIARAAEATRITEVGTILGTAAYLAPEQAAGEEVTPATDIYALGAVMYEALAGERPYAFDTLPELVRKQAEEPVRPLRELARDIPAALEAVVLRCLARRPEERPASAAELAGELARATPEPPTEPLGVRSEDRTRVLGAAPPAATLPRGRRRATWIAIALAAAVLAAVALALASGGDAEPDAQQPARVEPVAPAATPAERARNLADWLRRYSR